LIVKSEFAMLSTFSGMTTLFKLLQLLNAFSGIFCHIVWNNCKTIGINFDKTLAQGYGQFNKEDT